VLASSRNDTGHMTTVAVLVISTSRSAAYKVLAKYDQIALPMQIGDVDDAAVDYCYADACSVQALRPRRGCIDGVRVVVEDRGRRTVVRAEEWPVGRDVGHFGISSQRR